MSAPLLDPIFIIASARSGSTLLFQNLSQHPLTWSNYQEADSIYHRFFPVDLYEGERVAEAAPTDIGREIERALFGVAQNKEHFKDTPLLGSLPRKLLQKPLRPLYRRMPIRMVEKTAANSLRVPLLHGMYPKAKFIFLVRRGEDVVSSLIENWTRRTRQKEGVVGFKYRRWHYVVPPGWVDMIPRPLPEICAFQWSRSVSTALADLNRLGCDYLLVKHEELIAAPVNGYTRILDFCGLPASPHFSAVVADANRVFTEGGSAPEPNKWQRLHSAEIASVRHMIDPVNEQFYEMPVVGTR